MINVFSTKDGVSFVTTTAPHSLMTNDDVLLRESTSALNLAPSHSIVFASEMASGGVMLNSPIIQMPWTIENNSFSFTCPSFHLPYFGVVAVIQKVNEVSYVNYFPCIGTCTPKNDLWEYDNVTPVKILGTDGAWHNISDLPDDATIVTVGGFMPRFKNSAVTSGVVNLYVYCPTYTTNKYKQIQIVVPANGNVIVNGIDTAITPATSTIKTDINNGVYWWVPFTNSKALVEGMMDYIDKNSGNGSVISSGSFVSI